MSGLSKEGSYSGSRTSKPYSSNGRHHPYNKNGSDSRGGGARRGGRNDGCFKCGEQGHFSRECPKGGTKSGDGCFKCGESGHFSRECPQNGGGGGKKSFSNDGCFKCGEPGHFSRECPNKSAPSNNFGVKFGQAGAGLSSVDWTKIELEPFQKDFYKETPETAAQTQSSIDEWKKEHDIECYAGYHETVKGQNENNNWNKRFYADESNKKRNKKNDNIPLPKPLKSFKDASFPSIIMNAIDKAGFENPTPIQSATWPMVLSGRNVIGIAQTGSGKTLAFLLPAIVHINAQPKLKYGDGPIALIIAPTRELACQIEGEVEKFACNTRHCCVYGGAKKWDQKRKLRNGVEIIIATPGRLLDFMETNVTNLKRVTYSVIDEADRLLDMGFEPQLNAILSQTRPDRQMLMFSATWPKEVRELAKKFMIPNGSDDDSNIMQVAVGTMDKLKAHENIKQIVTIMMKNEKISRLKKYIDDQKELDKNSKILVFISTKKMTNMMQNILWEDGYWVTCMHGDKEQKQRDRALNDFKTGKMKIMLATDVASRGIHVDDIALVINFDFPTHIEDYVHRIGRTGRAGRKGTAVSFFVEDIDGYRAKDLIKILKETKQEIPAELLKLQKSSRGGRRNGGRNFYGRNNFGRRWW
eukprot:214591_1